MLNNKSTSLNDFILRDTFTTDPFYNPALSLKAVTYSSNDLRMENETENHDTDITESFKININKKVKLFF